MKKKTKIVIGTVAVVLIVLWSLNGVLSNRPYTKVLEVNWGIDLPEAGVEEVYSFSAPSFHGDGIRYHVIDYPAGNESKRILNAMFQIEKIFAGADFPTSEQIADVEELLKDIDIRGDAIPDWSKYQLVYMKQQDNSELYLFYWSGTGTIYIVESFL